MSQVNFLRENPVVAGIQQAQQMEATQARGELLRMQTDAAREKGRQDRAASEALNQIWANGGGNLSSADVNRRLAQDPRLGGGRRLEALQTAETQDNQRTQVEAQARERNAREFKLFVDSGAYAAAAETAQRMGLKIPPTFWENKEQVAALRERLKTEDMRAGISQKRAAAGASQALAQSRQPDPYEDIEDAEGRIVRRDKKTGEAKYLLGPDGQPIVKRDSRVEAARVRGESAEAVAETRAQQPGRAGGRMLNIEAKRQMLEEAGYPPREAAALAAGGGISPAQRAQISERIRNSVGRMTGRTGMPLTPEEQAAEVKRREEGVFGEQQQPGAPAQAQAAPAAPKDSTDIPRGADGKVDHRQLVDGQTYLIPLKRGGQTTGRWNAQTGRFDEVN